MLDYRHCTLCPRACGVDRTAGERGFCQMPDHILAARAALHYWEEPVISGSFGSGAVFFSGCTLRCAFCQNGVISQENFGKEVSSQELRAAFERLIDEGCQNINLVTPTHFLPSILPALAPKLPVPVVYNCGGYERVETLRELEGLIDIYLPDMKYMSPVLAGKYSKAQDYPAGAMAALAEMFRQVGTPVFEVEKPDDNTATDEAGLIMKRGMIVRHLVLPGCTADSKAVVKYLYDTYGDDIYMSIMSQYTPMPELMPGGKLNALYPELGRCVTQEEYDEVVDYAIELGVENAFIQEGDVAKDSFIPDFDMLAGV